MSQDFVVMGAGFVGLSTAYWLRELAPDSKILVIDPKGIGAGASGKNAGFLTKGSAFFYQHLMNRWGEEKALEIFNFSRISLELLHQNILMASTLDYMKTSSLTLYRAQKPKLPLAFGFRDEASSFPSHFAGALRSADEFRVRSSELLEILYQNLLKKNVSFSLGKAETRTDGKKTIFCLNAYTSQALPEYSDRIYPRRAQMLRVRLKTPNSIGQELYYDPAERVYFFREAVDQLLIGGKRLMDVKGEETFLEGNSEIIQSALETYLTSLGLDFEVMDRWSGIMGFTESELPLLEDQGSRLIIGGFSGHGMGLGFHAGKVAAELALGLKTHHPF